MIESIFNRWECVNAQYEELCTELDTAWDKVHELTPCAHRYPNELQEAWDKVNKLQGARRRIHAIKKDLETLFDNLTDNPTFTAVEL